MIQIIWYLIPLLSHCITVKLSIRVHASQHFSWFYHIISNFKIRSINCSKRPWSPIHRIIDLLDSSIPRFLTLGLFSICQERLALWARDCYSILLCWRVAHGLWWSQNFPDSLAHHPSQIDPMPLPLPWWIRLPFELLFFQVLEFPISGTCTCPCTFWSWCSGERFLNLSLIMWKSTVGPIFDDSIDPSYALFMLLTGLKRYSNRL